MPEVAKCPCCGKDPIVDDEDFPNCAYSCCGQESSSLKQWNRYAAAMELAIATAAYFTLATEAGHKRLQEAGQRVLEVFK